MQRVLIIGSPGAGKSTLAPVVGAAIGAPVIHLDSLFWSDGWVMRPREEFRELLESALEGESWVIDGNYASTLRLRMERADTIIYLDFPTRVCLWRVLKRIVTSYGKTRPDMAQGCPERFDLEFLRYVVRFRRDERPEVETILRENPEFRVHRVTRQRELATVRKASEGAN